MEHNKPIETTMAAFSKVIGKESAGHDNVNSPSHYKQNGKETIDTIKDSMSNEEFAGYLKGNIQKYLARFKFKNGVEDLKKARWYLDKLISENE